MIASYTAKVDIKAHKALAAVQRTVQEEMNDLIRKSNEALPDVELIFCPIVMPKEQLHNWREKTKRNKLENWISFEKWLEFDPFVPPAQTARATYVKWVKETMLEAEIKFPELEPVRRVFDRLIE